MTSTLVEPNFSGYATRYGLKCSDGRTITPDAFKHMDGQEIPLVWQHQHDDPGNVLGYAKLSHRADGMYAECYLNDGEMAQKTDTLIQHRDVRWMSIYATGLREKNKAVLHGEIGEVSVVLKGANPGAQIDYVRIQHGDGTLSTAADQAVIFNDDETTIEFEHAATGTETGQDIFNTLDDKQKQLFEYMISQALQQGGTAQHSADDKHAQDESEGAESENEKGDDKPDTETDKDKTDDTGSVVEHSDKDGNMTRNVFEQNKQNAGDGVQNGGTLRHSLTGDQLDSLKHSVFADMKRGSSFREAILAHVGEYGITNVEVLFPDAQTVDNRPEWITRRMEWVGPVLSATNKLPFSRIKSRHADLTQDSARAKGYIKTKMKKEQFFALTTRETTPKTIYKKQKLDRDDIIDVTDFDIVEWIWGEMRFMLDEEIARAILISDGREVDDDDKIDESAIRPIAYDDTFYTDVVNVDANVDGQDMIDAVLRARQYYKGNAPTAYMTTSVMMDMMLARDAMGNRRYKNKEELAGALMVQGIVEVPVMEGAQRDGAEIQMVIVNLRDYSVGTTKGGEITKFEDFDIDVNQHKYLIEGRMSGALTRAKTAQVVVRGSGTQATPTIPAFNNSTGVITIPTVTGVTYKVQVAGPLGAAGTTLSSGAQTALTTGQSQAIVATPNSGYYFPHNFDADWTFTKS